MSEDLTVQLRLRGGANSWPLPVSGDSVTTLIVCKRSGQLPHECGLSACENGCPEEELTFVRAEVVPPAEKPIVTEAEQRYGRHLDVIASNLARAAQSTDEGMRRIVEGMVRDNERIAGRSFERPTDAEVELSIERTWVGGVEGEETIWTILIAGAGGQTSIDWHATEQEAIHRAVFLHETLSMVLGFTGLVVTLGEGIPALIVGKQTSGPLFVEVPDD